MQKSFLQSGKISNLIRVKKPLFMGILNVTPDSFSDGGKYFQSEDAILHAKKLIKQGIDIIDVGGESTKPEAKPVSEEEELKRVIPVIKELNDKLNPFLISIDTYKSNVAKEALEVGANMINDVSGLTMDLNMVNIARDANCPIVIMHNKGIPATKPDNVSHHCEKRNDGLSIVNEVYNWLHKQIQYAIANGIKKENIIVDPGIGFGKTPEEDLELINNCKEFKSLGFPILVGPSRKSFIKKLFGDKNIEIKSKEITDLVIKNGADIVRVHEVIS